MKKNKNKRKKNLVVYNFDILKIYNEFSRLIIISWWNFEKIVIFSNYSDKIQEAF